MGPIVDPHTYVLPVRHTTYDALNMQSSLRRWDLLGTPEDDYLYIFTVPATIACWSGTASRSSATSPSGT